MSLKYIAGEDLRAGQIVQLNEEDGKFYAYKMERSSDFVLVLFEDVKKDQVIEREKRNGIHESN